MHIKGKRYDMEHIIHLIREIDYLRTQIKPHDTGHIHTTINTLEHRVEQLMSEHGEPKTYSFSKESMPYVHESDYHGC